MNAQFQRVVVIGSLGSGKSTFAQRLAEILGSPHIELDALLWGPNWVQKPRDEFQRLVEAAVSRECWVVDGGYAREWVWPRATSVIWLNYTFPIVFKRALIRTVRRLLTGEELYASNRETVRRGVGFLWAVIRTFRHRRLAREELRKTNTFPHLVWFELKKPDEAETFLQRLRSAS